MYTGKSNLQNRRLLTISGELQLYTSSIIEGMSTDLRHKDKINNDKGEIDTNHRNIAIEEIFEKGLLETILHLAFCKWNDIQQNNEYHYRQRGQDDLDSIQITLNNI